MDSLSTGIGKVALRTALDKVIKTYRNNKFDKLIKRLETGEISLTDNELQSDDFIACFIKTIDAIDKAISKEKVAILENLFINGIETQVIRNTPTLYEETLSIISDLSIREIEILFILSEELSIEEAQEESTIVLERNQKAKKRICQRYNISAVYTAALLHRLERTGLIVDGNFIGGPEYFMSPLYQEIKKLIHYEIWQS